MVEVSKNQVCASCGSSELTICYFKHELDPNKHMTTLTFNTEFREGWTKAYHCSKCKNVHVRFNIFT